MTTGSAGITIWLGDKMYMVGDPVAFESPPVPGDKHWTYYYDPQTNAFLPAKSNAAQKFLDAVPDVPPLPGDELEDEDEGDTPIVVEDK